MTMKYYDGALLGLAVGSAMGQPVEFMSPEQVRIKLGRVDRMLEGNWRGLRRGEVTPEAELAFILADRLLERGAYDRAAAAQGYVRWYREERPELEHPTRAALALIEDGIAVEQAAREAHDNASGQEAGSAALVRTIPLALLHADDPEALVRDVKADVTITHVGREATGASLALQALIAQFASGVDDPSAALDGAIGALGRERTPIASLRDTDPAQPPRATGHPHDTLRAAWSAVIAPTTSHEALADLVTRGEDSATVGAVAGALIGARLGPDAWPATWRNAVTCPSGLSPASRRG